MIQLDLVAYIGNSKFSIFVQNERSYFGKGFHSQEYGRGVCQVPNTESGLCSSWAYHEGKWNPLDAVVSVTVYVNDKNGKVNATKRVLAVTTPGFYLQDISAIFL